MSDQTPAQVWAARKATIDRALKHILATDRATLLAQLATTSLHDHVKADPDGLAGRLGAVTADDDSAARFSCWKAAQQVCRAAGLPY
jgi:hypothetical protein